MKSAALVAVRHWVAMACYAPFVLAVGSLVVCLFVVGLIVFGALGAIEWALLLFFAVRVPAKGREET